jgi:hypothetical protein
MSRSQCRVSPVPRIVSQLRSQDDSLDQIYAESACRFSRYSQADPDAIECTIVFISLPVTRSRLYW